MKIHTARSAALIALKCSVAAPAFLFAGAVYAQDMGGTEMSAASNTGDIIVTARRRDESLQDVPQTVNAVTSQAIEKLNLQNFKDIQAVVPGLSLGGGVTGSDAGFSLRGASYNTLSQSSPTVQFYINESPVDANLIFQSMYDVGQIEVLRGPQGTLRGRSAPSGAITLTTRRADLTEVGGYANMTGTTRGGINVNAALNVPLIDDILAVRVSGLVDHNRNNDIRSINNGTAPYGRTESGRVSVMFAPTDTIRASVMYQYLTARYHTFQPMLGFQNAFSGVADAQVAPGVFFPVPVTSPAGPTIRPGERLAVSEGATDSRLRNHLVNGSIDWRIAGQKLSYVGTYVKNRSNTQTPQDEFNVFAGFEAYMDIGPSGSNFHSHEVRLASEERLGGVLDYTVGVYLGRLHGAAKGVIGQTNPFVPLEVFLSTDLFQNETSVFGSATLHLGDRTELTGGVRRIRFTSRNPAPYTTLGEGNSLCIPLAGFCFASASDVPIKETAWVWNAAVSHRFNESFLVYGSAGTSYRPPFSILVTSALTGTNPATGLPLTSSNDLRDKPAEKSTGFEVGFKSNFFDNRIRLNVAGYHQKFKDNNFYLNSVPFYDLQNGVVAQNPFTANADAVVWGVDVDASIQFTPTWNLTAGFAWADGHVDNDEVPCRDSNFDGTPDNGTPTVAGFQAANVFVARCQSDESISTAPRWSLTLQSEYAHPVSDNVDGFVRGLFTYNPENPNNNRSIAVDAYGLLNLYAGIRSPDNAWEVSFFAKNLTNTNKIINYFDIPPNSVVNLGGPTSASIPINYREVGYTTPREFGLNVRYAFGSR